MSALFQVVQGHACDHHYEADGRQDVEPPLGVALGRLFPQLGIFLAQRLIQSIHDAGPVSKTAAAALVAAQVRLGEAPRRDDERLAGLGPQPRVGAVDGHGHRHARGAGDGVALTSIAVVDARRPEDDGRRWGSLLAARRADGGSPTREAGAQVVVAAHDDGEEEAPAAAPHFALLRSRLKQTVNADVGCSKLRAVRGEGSEGCLLATGDLRMIRSGLEGLDTLEMLARGPVSKLRVGPGTAPLRL